MEKPEPYEQDSFKQTVATSEEETVASTRAEV
jgi:hypothetical protein